jgi:LPS sulfotransferase NodH
MEEFEIFFGKRGLALAERYLKILPRGMAGAPPFAGVAKKLMICCTSRTGSTLLCQKLRTYGVPADEYFNPDLLPGHRDRSGAGNYVELCAYLASAYAPRSIFCTKGTFQAVMPLYLAGEYPQALGEWRFVFLTRVNLVRQAISMLLAQKRLSYFPWHPPVREVTDADYSTREIAATIDNITVGNAWWEKFFAQFGITPFRLTYEELAADPDGAAARVADDCGLERYPLPPSDSPASREDLQQITPFNAAWEQRFREDARIARF